MGGFPLGAGIGSGTDLVSRSVQSIGCRLANIAGIGWFYGRNRWKGAWRSPSGTLKEVAFLGTTYGREPAETTTAHIQLTMSSARNHHSAC